MYVGCGRRRLYCSDACKWRAAHLRRPARVRTQPPAGTQPRVRTYTAEQRAGAEQRMLENTGLVGFALNRLNFPPHQAEDVAQVAMLGLWRAALAFDDTRGFRFSTYAIRAINNAVSNYLQSPKGREPGWTPAQGWIVNVESLNAPGPAGDTRELGHTLAATSDTAHEAETRETCRAVLAAVRDLPDRQRVAVTRVLIDGEQPRNVARDLGISRQRVEKIIDEARPTLIAARAA